MILKKSEPNVIATVKNALLENKIVIIPTDTVYGFSGIVPGSDFAIRAIKGRDEVKPFIQLISKPEDIEKYSDTKIPHEIKKHMPGPLTVIVKNKFDDGTTAFRCPDDTWLQKLISECNCPLYSTSTNRSGEPILNTIAEIEKEFATEVFCIVDGDLDTTTSIPSTIVDITGDEIKVIRQGSVIL